ncbi:MAG: D-alanine--D-alanine ligase, partial [Lachnospiraceae bacterium]|nr:D-alanine--D-alanine ligase [Lachnospiraceae bacterium]
INENAIKIFKNIGLSGVARIDFIYDTANSKVYANEVNAVPGSLSYYLFEPKGIKYKELLDKLIKIALDNYKAAERLNFTFESNVLK